MKTTALAIACLAFLTAFASASPCNEKWDGLNESCANEFYAVSQNPAYSSGEFSVRNAALCINSVNGGPQAISIYGNDGTRVTSFKMPELVLDYEPIYGWVTHERLLVDAKLADDQKLDGITCDVGEANEQNREKTRFDYEFNEGNRTTQIFCYRKAIPDHLDTWLYWDIWGQNGTTSKEVIKQVEQTQGISTDTGGGIIYSAEVSFDPNVTKCGKISYDISPRAGFVNESIGLGIEPVAPEKMSGGGDESIYFDPFVYTTYGYEIEVWVNETSGIKRVNELLTYNITNWTNLCQDVGCHDVRVAILYDNGTFQPQPNFYPSQNYTLETDIKGNSILLPAQPVYGIAPAQNQPLFVSFPANVSPNNYSHVANIYVSSPSVTTWPADVLLYGTSFCNASAYGGNWSNLMTGSFESCSWTTASNNQKQNYLFVNRTGGIITTDANNSGGSHDPVWLRYIMDDPTGDWSNAYVYTPHTSITGGNTIYQKYGAAYTIYDSWEGSVLPELNSTYAFSVYRNGTSRMEAYYINGSSQNSTSVLANNYLTTVNGTNAINGFIGYQTYGSTTTIRNFCWLYTSLDDGADGYFGKPRDYCKTYLGDYGGSITATGNFTNASMTNVTIYAPTNATHVNPFSIIYSAFSPGNATFPCNVTLDTTSIYNESAHANATNTSFTWTTLTGFHTLNVTCMGSQSAVRYFTIQTGIDVHIYDELNGTAVNASLSISNGTQTNTTVMNTSFTFAWSDLPLGSLTIITNASSYYPRTYYVTNSQTGYTNLSIYLLPTGASAILVRFHVRTVSNAPIANATVNIQRNIGGSIVTVGQQLTDAPGDAAFYMELNGLYYLQATHPSYLPFFSSLNPTSNDYTITMTTNSSTAGFPISIFEDVTWVIKPYANYLNANESTNITLIISSSNASLTYWGMNVSWNGTLQLFYQNVTTSPSGGSLNFPFNGTNYTSGNITVVFFFKRNPEYTGLRLFDIIRQLTTNGVSLKDFQQDYANSGLSKISFAIIGLLFTLLAAAWVSRYSPLGAAAVTIIMLALMSGGGWLDIPGDRFGFGVGSTISGWALTGVGTIITLAWLYLKERL